jgi:hypothetical protein
MLFEKVQDGVPVFREDVQADDFFRLSGGRLKAEGLRLKDRVCLKQN